MKAGKYLENNLLFQITYYSQMQTKKLNDEYYSMMQIDEVSIRDLRHTVHSVGFFQLTIYYAINS